MKMRTLGLPVVPLLRSRKASLVRPSPAFNVLLIEGRRESHSSVRWEIVAVPEDIDGPRTTIRFVGKSAILAALYAFSSAEACTTIKQGLVSFM